MAAKPPKPPATFLKQSRHNNSNNNVDDDCVDDSNGNSKNEASTSAALAAGTASATPTSTPPNAEKYSKLGIRRYNSRDNLLNYISNDSESEATATAAAAAAAAGSSSAEGAAAVQRPTCNCTNISIMHLFHEMKQEFPTIPDPIVAQCVNENCHQRENCIQMLRNELALNPIPVQTYPAKVLQQLNINQQHNNHNHQLQQQQQQQKQQQQPRKNSLRTPPHPQPPQRQKNASPQKPPTPLRPIRAAPTTPSQLPSPARTRAGANSSGSVIPPNQCDSVELLQNNNRNLLKDVQSVHSAQCNNPCIDNKSPSDNSNNNSSVSEFSSKNTCDMPAAATANAPANASIDCARTSDFIAQLNRVATNPAPPTSPAKLDALGQRARPNTLNLQASQQQLQRQQLNKQLQQHLQQRSQLKHQPQQQQQQDLPLQKPIRKAPLPPIAPKPVFHNNIGYNNNNSGNNNNNSCGNSPQSQSGTSYSTESNLASPISSCSGENEISSNIVSSSVQAFAHRQNNNTPASTAPTYQPAQPQPQPQPPSSPLRSPIRHRSVINVQPEPPYTRDFLPAAKIGTSTATSPATTGGSGGGSGASTPTSQKSFTSVNLTLRQPTAAVPQSTIDISAGPVLSGHGSGLTYSSTSYNARHGFKQNFHITVTEEGGVFNASRIGPRNSGYYAGIEESDNSGGPTGGSGQTTSVTQYQQTPITALKSPTTQQQQQQQQGIQNITPQAIQTATATTTTGGEEMCLPFENSVFIETIKRQKTRRDKLATALRENKKKIGDVEEEINMLTEPLNPSESSRLDYEIERLRNDCQQMLNEIENIRRYGQLNEADRLKLQQQQQQQAFLRQRPPRPPPPILQQQQQQQQQQQSQPQSPYQYPQTEQHHNTPGSGSSSVHSSTPCTTNTPLHLQHSPLYNQTTGHAAPASLPYQQPSTDEEDYSDSNTDGGDDYEPLDRWACSMCTFLNHPQLNICETCECVRIIPEPILRRENIHITLSPGENRIVHSWVVS
ncbi:homeobox protein 5 isoform X2 [Ceratitis capitata]|uniref:(Mediterranean fruit fly) hypothetical protein n=1 Tax=Ceratitis capitata TaxID=7213 RepID=A0A811VB85_CERCA|nr:homeobox protein 5 isoform X2 [Ceratitis capitata]CAD7012241.1 unnamed protein product [Ceratitis capitata]